MASPSPSTFSQSRAPIAPHTQTLVLPAVWRPGHPRTVWR
jgi:hypothetical protein